MVFIAAFLLISSRQQSATLFPYTTLFRSQGSLAAQVDTSSDQSYNLTMKTIGAAKFKEQCLALLDRIDPEGIVITKRGKPVRSEEHTSELQSRGHLVCRLLLEKKKINTNN